MPKVSIRQFFAPSSFEKCLTIEPALQTNPTSHFHRADLTISSWIIAPRMMKDRDTPDCSSSKLIDNCLGINKPKQVVAKQSNLSATSFESNHLVTNKTRPARSVAPILSSSCGSRTSSRGARDRISSGNRLQTTPERSERLKTSSTISPESSQQTMT